MVVFYLMGVFYHIAKRLTGVQYVSNFEWKSIQNPESNCHNKVNKAFVATEKQGTLMSLCTCVDHSERLRLYASYIRVLLIVHKPTVNLFD